MQQRLPHRGADPEVPRLRQARPLPRRLPHDLRGQLHAVDHRPGLLPPLRDRVQPGRARRADRHQERRALPRRLRSAAAAEPAHRAAAAAERQDGGDRGIRPRRPGVRVPPAPPRLRQRDLRGHGQAGRHAARRHPALAPARGNPRRGDRQADQPGRHRHPVRGAGRHRRPHLGRPEEQLRRGVPRAWPGRRPAMDMPGSQARGVTGALEFLREAGLGRRCGPARRCW